MLIEERLAIGHVKISIVTAAAGNCAQPDLERFRVWRNRDPSARTGWGGEHAERQRACARDVSKVEDIVHATDAEAFVISEDVRPLRHGFWRA